MIDYKGDLKKVQKKMAELGYVHEASKPDVNSEKLRSKFINKDWDWVLGAIEVYQDHENKIYTIYERSENDIEDKEWREDYNSRHGSW